MRTRIAYLPLSTYPEAPPDAWSWRRSSYFGIAGVQVAGLYFSWSTFLSSIHPWVDCFSTFRALPAPTEERSGAECRPWEGIVKKAAGPHLQVLFKSREVVLGAVLDAAAAEARLFRPFAGSVVW